jgi:hypothetical protein
VIKTMIALVSDQRMQNVIPILQIGASYKELVLVLSKERRTGKPLPQYRRSADDLKAVLENCLEVRTCDELVDPYDIDAVTNVVGSLLENGNQNNVVVNISGGTKPMAIGALRAAQAAGATCLYTNTEDSEILWLSPNGSTRSEPIRVVGLDVPLYIRAYGEKVSSSSKVADLDAVHKTWAEMIGYNHRAIYQKVVVPVTSAIKKAYREESGFPVTCKAKPTRRQQVSIEQLAQKGLWQWSPSSDQIALTDRLAASFLRGTWVEVYVAMQMQCCDLFDDVRLNVKLDGVEGEIDVAAVSNGKLVLIECKSNVQRSQQLSKLDSLRRRLGGPYAQAYYARASEAYARKIREQCSKFRLNGVFFGAQLGGIGKEIGKNVGALAKQQESTT